MKKYLPFLLTLTAGVVAGIYGPKALAAVKGSKPVTVPFK